MIGFITSYLFGKPTKLLASGIELPAADEVRQILFTFFMKTVKQIVLAVKAKRFGGDGKRDDLKICELGNDATSGNVSKIIYTVTGEFLADSKDSNKISDEVAYTKNIYDFIIHL